tara:strand:- start:527 stop:1060 length:534 start_codon:yes stop_codon:yes gene_type:complete
MIKRPYLLVKSKTVIDNQSLMIRDLHIAHANFKKVFPDKSSTWGYSSYNIFAITTPSPLFYSLFKELNLVIREYVGHDKPLWMQAWLNYHMPDEVLKEHAHDWKYNGYISIDPKNTKTVFAGYKIINEVGNIYIGPGHSLHKVEVVEDYDTPRLTIGFDVHDEEGMPYDQFSMIPIL